MNVYPFLLQMSCSNNKDFIIAVFRSTATQKEALLCVLNLRDSEEVRII